MIFYPNCSEIVAYIKVNTHEEFQQAVQDIIDATGEHLIYRCDDYHKVHENKDGTYTIDVYGYMDRDDDWMDKAKDELQLRDGSFVVLIEPRHLVKAGEEIGVNIWDEEFTVLLGPEDHSIDWFDEESQDEITTIERVKLKRMDKRLECYIQIGSLGLMSDLDEREPTTEKRSVGVMADSHGNGDFEPYVKVIEALKSDPTFYMWSYDGGSLDPFERWCCRNHQKFILNLSDYGLKEPFYDVTFYIFERMELEGLQKLLLRMNEVGYRFCEMVNYNSKIIKILDPHIIEGVKYELRDLKLEGEDDTYPMSFFYFISDKLLDVDSKEDQQVDKGLEHDVFLGIIFEEDFIEGGEHVPRFMICDRDIIGASKFKEDLLVFLEKEAEQVIEIKNSREKFWKKKDGLKKMLKGIVD